MTVDCCWKLFRIIVTLLYCLTNVMNSEFKLGMLSPFRHPRLGWENNAAAATIAVDKAKQEGILVEHNISVLWKDDGCSAEGGTAGTMMFKDEDVDVYIGPPCSISTKPSGLLARYWNLPMFSQASTDPALEDKSVYKTLVRLGPPFNKMGKAFVELFKHYNWTQVVIISKRKSSQRHVFCDYSTRSVETAFSENDIKIVDFIPIEAGIADGQIDIVLSRARQRARIIILCTEITSDRRRILAHAHRKGMTDGSYVYLLPDHLPPEDISSPWKTGNDNDVEAKMAFTSAFQISVAEMAGPDVETFRDLVSEKMAHEPWNYKYTKDNNIRGSEYSAFLHDVVYLYLIVLNETLANNENPRNGTLMFERAKGKTFRGMTGNVKVDDNGDREPDYWVWDLVPGATEFHVAMEISLTSADSEKIQILKEIVWETTDGKAPPSTPICGFLNENCPPAKSNIILTVSIFTVVAIVLGSAASVTGYLWYRRAKFDREVELKLWTINGDDIRMSKARFTNSISQLSLRSVAGSKSAGDRISDVTDNLQLFSKIGFYKGTVVAMKCLNPQCISLTQTDLHELKAMRDLRNENVNTFIGMCTEECNPCLLTAYCNKGSLEDIIENEDIKLDWLFKVSLINDLTNAIYYIHSSPLRYHGNIKSSNCLVDNRWVLKMTDYGLTRMRNLNRRRNLTEYKYYTGMFWTAPELIDNSMQIHTGTQKADIYALSVVLFEILYRRSPYDTVTTSPEEIIKRVQAREVPPYRPSHFNDEAEDNIENDWKVGYNTRKRMIQLLNECWSDNPECRPPMPDIRYVTRELYEGRKVNIVDNMVLMLEKYAVNLETVVEQRTAALIEEKQKTDTLLYRMLPTTVAEDLKCGKIVRPEVFENVTIYFSDIVGFTALSSESTPIEIVDFLNDLYSAFDARISQRDVYKVETIGDAYMVVSGLPVRNDHRHAEEIALMSLDLLKCAKEFKIEHKPETILQLRIGINTGPCAAGVVGRTMPRYCLFGDTVNIASRMESTGEAMKIHLSQSAKTALDVCDKFQTEVRGSIEIKGKGSEMTYWLIGSKC